MWSDNVTVCLMVYNEEKRVEYALRNFHGKFKILVVDDLPASTDKTREICERYGVEYMTVAKRGHLEQPCVMGPVWDRIKTDYMIYAMCAEYLPDELLRLYAQVANDKSYDIVCANRISICAGKHLYVWGRNKMRWIPRIGPGRFSRRGSINYEGNPIHRYGKVTCDKRRILPVSDDPKLMYYQFMDYDAQASEAKCHYYNNTIARHMHEAGERYSFWKMIYKSIREFLIAYIIYGAWQDGHLGFMHSWYRFLIWMGIYLRMWDIEHNLQQEQIAAIHCGMKNKLLAGEMKVESLLYLK